MRIMLCLVGLAVAIVSPFTVLRAVGQVSPDGARTVALIADTLDRLGEGKLARRLRDDLRAKKVTFGVIRDYGVLTNPDTTAQVKAGKMGYGGVDTNALTINQVHEDRFRTTKASRPYDPQGSFLVSLASTMTHEYKHMGQTFPRQEPKWEDPAYRAQEAAIGRWVQKLSAEIDAQAGTPAGDARARALRETTDLLRLIRSDCGTMRDAIQQAEKSGWITARKHWQYANYITLIDRQLERVAKLEPGIAEWDRAAAGRTVDDGAKPDPLARKVPSSGAWVLFNSHVWSNNPNIDQAVQEYANGMYKVQGSVLPGVSRHTWVNPNREGSPKTSLAVTWTQPTAMVPPGGEIIVTATAADTGSSANAAEGDFVSFSVGLHGTTDGKNWTFLAGNFPSLYASPRKQDSRTYRVPAPRAKYRTLVLDVSTGNTSWGKCVRYEYVWKDGPASSRPASPSKGTRPPTRRGR